MLTPQPTPDPTVVEIIRGALIDAAGPDATTDTTATAIATALAAAATITVRPTQSEPSEIDPQSLLERTRATLEAALVKARRVVNSVNRGDDRAVHEATEHLVIDFLKPMEREDLERVTTNALLFVVQLQDNLKTLQAAYRGVRGRS